MFMHRTRKRKGNPNDRRTRSLHRRGLDHQPPDRSRAGRVMLRCLKRLAFLWFRWSDRIFISGSTHYRLYNLDKDAFK
jgi:hypothetical protein